MTEKLRNVDEGVAVIKAEFILPDHVPTLALDCVSAEDQGKILKEEEPSQKKFKWSKKGKNSVLKGQNKARGPTYKQEKETNLCPQLIDIAPDKEKLACTHTDCKFVHDVEVFLASKPPDIADECYIFSTKGYCPRGITCRFGKSHITSDGRNIRKCDEYDDSSRNFLSKDLQNSLRKRSYDFEKSEKIVAKFDRRKQDTKVENDSPNSVEKRVGYAEDGDLIPLKMGEKRKIDWKNKLVLSPLTTVGNLPFRRICKEFGADVTCGEMALASSLLQGKQQEWALVRRHNSEDIFGVQLCGNNPYIMTKCSQLLQETIDIDFIDVNLGCPIDLIYQQGCGSGLLRRDRMLENILKGMSHILNVPLTVKTRTGIHKDIKIAHKLVPRFLDCGVSMISIHGRTREQRYTKSADWDYIEECAKLAADRTPVFGNGDILSYADYNEKREKYPHISGALIARGALYKPWLFTEIKEQRDWDISSSERMDIIKKYVNYGLEHWGSDTKGVENTRRFLLEWQSFLHRYIPVGLLERPPQKINQRPPVYHGRDDLETLFASPNCKDWIKISEMLLGPVPDGFHFLPKHKASSWK